MSVLTRGGLQAVKPGRHGDVHPVKRLLAIVPDNAFTQLIPTLEDAVRSLHSAIVWGCWSVGLWVCWSIGLWVHGSMGLLVWNFEFPNVELSLQIGFDES